MFTSQLHVGNSDSRSVRHLIMVVVELVYIGANQNICTELSHPVLQVIFVILQRYFPESNTFYPKTSHEKYEKTARKPEISFGNLDLQHTI